MSEPNFPRVLRPVSCRRPRCGEWFRVRPGDDWISETAIFRDAKRRTRYLVSQFIWDDLRDRISRTTIRVCQSWSGETFLWAIPHITQMGMHGRWAESADDIAGMAEDKWCMLAPVVSAERFAVWEAEEPGVLPAWSARPLWQLIVFAFRDRVIESVDHPALRREPI